jgi:uncharacterized membrane protein
MPLIKYGDQPVWKKREPLQQYAHWAGWMLGGMLFVWCWALISAGWRPIGLLALSALTTTLSWVCYYRAMHEGTVSYVSLVDKGSILVTLVLSVLLLGEPFTWRMAVGATLIIGGLLVLAGGK